MRAVEVRACPAAPFATVTGRYYAMDRDKRWERVPQAYAAMVDGEGERAPDAVAAVAAAHAAGMTDEFVPATVIGDYRGCATATASSASTSAPTACGRSCHALLEPDFDGLPPRAGAALRERRRHDGVLGRAQRGA